MKRNKLAAAAIIGCCLLAARSGGAELREFYVATDGQDSNPGTKAKPFATLERARDAVRALSGAARAGGATVWIRGGVYRRESTFELNGPADSGTAGAPVVYRGCDGEQARLIGGVIVPASAFRPVRDTNILARLEPAARTNVLEADLKALGVKNLAADWPLAFRGYDGWPELFFDGKAMELARWPNTGWARVARVLARGSKPRHNEQPDRPGSFMYSGDRPERWLKAEEVYLNGHWAYKWHDQCLKVGKIDTTNKAITLAAPSFYGLGGASGGDYYAFNLLEELDAPGEYYLDRKTGRLYFWPPACAGAPGSLEGKEIAVSMLQTPLMRLNGTSRVTVRNLTFEYSCGMGSSAAWATNSYLAGTHREVNPGGWVAWVTNCYRPRTDWKAIESAACEITDGTNNLLAGCTMRNLASDAVCVYRGLSNGVTGCDLCDLGAGAIYLLGGDFATLTPCGNYADNNHIHHYGRLCRVKTAVGLGTHPDRVAVGCRVTHNLIHHAPLSAIGAGGNDHLIEYNDIYKVCMDADDCGAINAGGVWTERGTLIRYNYMHDLGRGRTYKVRGIMVDGGHGIISTGNIIDGAEIGIISNGGRDNVVSNNLFRSCNLPVWVLSSATENRKSLLNNECYQCSLAVLKSLPYQAEPWRSRYPTLATILDDNPTIPRGIVVANNLSVWCGQMKGMENVAKYGVLGFNGTPRSYNPREPHPGYKPDFARIPVDQIGLYTNEYRPILPARAK